METDDDLLEIEQIGSMDGKDYRIEKYGRHRREEKDICRRESESLTVKNTVIWRPFHAFLV